MWAQHARLEEILNLVGQIGNPEESLEVQSHRVHTTVTHGPAVSNDQDPLSQFHRFWRDPNAVVLGQTSLGGVHSHVSWSLHCLLSLDHVIHRGPDKSFSI
jgi:hypothetical protein